MDFKNLFHNKKQSESVVCIDISADSIAGAYARYTENEMPVLLYTCRLPIEIREREPHARAMLRALQILGDTLIREGAPILSRATGSGSAHTVLVSIDTPWQETNVRTEHLEREQPFIFTKSIVSALLKNTTHTPSEKRMANESVISTVLNGYETRNPYGKKIHRAALVILTSLIDTKISESIISVCRGFFHTDHILTIAGRSLRYQAIRVAFPHERDALIIDATGPRASIALIRKNLFVALAEISNPTANAQAWMRAIMSEFTTLAEKYPLPHVIFLLARESEISLLQQTLTAIPVGQLWLSDNPPKIVPVLASYLSGSVRQTTTEPPDLPLLLMGLYYGLVYQHHSPAVE